MSTNATATTATITIGIYWSPVSKCWILRAADQHGNVVATQRAQTTTELDTPAVAFLLRGLRSELESFLPF